MNTMVRLCLTLCLVGCTTKAGVSEGSTGFAAPGPVTTVFQPGIELAESPNELDSGITRTKFNFVSLRDLWVRVNVQGIPQLTILHLSFYTPQGVLLYENSISFSPNPLVREHRRPNVAVPLAVATARQQPGGVSLDYPIAIGGSVFTRWAEPGTWVVKAELTDIGESYSKQFEVVFDK